MEWIYDYEQTFSDRAPKPLRPTMPGVCAARCPPAETEERLSTALWKPSGRLWIRRRTSVGIPSPPPTGRKMRGAAMRKRKSGCRWNAGSGMRATPGAGPGLAEYGRHGFDRRSLALLQSLEHRGEARRPCRQKDDGGEAPQGRLSARYESGSRGAAAVGYDRNGGTSYGTYQISSASGHVRPLPRLSRRGRTGPADRLRRPDRRHRRHAGGRSHGMEGHSRRTARTLRGVAGGIHPRRHYDPALQGVREALGLDDLSPALQEVLWSTAVQHGPTGARRLFGRPPPR